MHDDASLVDAFLRQMFADFADDADQVPIIGIVGPSCSGKSSVAARIAAALDALVFHQDDYWISGANKPLVNGEPTFERPEQYDGHKLAMDVAVAAKSDGCKAVVVEGITLLCYNLLSLGMHPRFFLNVPQEVLVARRAARAATTADPGGNKKSAQSERSWLANGYIEWLHYGASQATMPGVIVIDGDRDVDTIAEEVLAHLRGLGGRPGLS